MLLLLGEAIKWKFYAVDGITFSICIFVIWASISLSRKVKRERIRIDLLHASYKNDPTFNFAVEDIANRKQELIEAFNLLNEIFPLENGTWKWNAVHKQVIGRSTIS